MHNLDDRLWVDYDEMTQLNSKVIRWTAQFPDSARRRPPTLYRFHYTLRGIVDGSGKEPKYLSEFDVELNIGPPYPTGKAKAYFTSTPIWHPNVHPDGRICYEDRWITGIGISPVRICEIIGMMIAYQLYGRRDQLPVRTSDDFWEQFESAKKHFPTDPRPIRIWDNTADYINLG